jgi:hypothetical protein
VWFFLAVGVISSIYFLYTGSQSAENVQEYLYPSFSLYHLEISVVSMLIAFSWIMFFLGFFARKFNFSHKILVPANISILPIYVLHQTLIIVIGYYVVNTELNIALKFAIITFTAIPAAVLIFKIVQTNNVLRMLFGMKRKQKEQASKKVNLEGTIAFDK